jgi:clan AA aspartic protease, AF_0612 family
MGLAFVEVEIAGRTYRALVDTGFNGEVLVNRRVAEEAGLKPFRSKERITVDGRRVRVEVAVATIKLWGEETEVFVEVLDELPLDVLIGVQALERLGYVVNPVTGRLEKVGLLAV